MSLLSRKRFNLPWVLCIGGSDSVVDDRAGKYEKVVESVEQYWKSYRICVVAYAAKVESQDENRYHSGRAINPMAQSPENGGDDGGGPRTQWRTRDSREEKSPEKDFFVDWRQKDYTYAKQPWIWGGSVPEIHKRMCKSLSCHVLPRLQEGDNNEHNNNVLEHSLIWNPLCIEILPECHKPYVN